MTMTRAKAWSVGGLLLCWVLSSMALMMGPALAMPPSSLPPVQRQGPEQFHVSFAEEPQSAWITWAVVGTNFSSLSTNPRCEYGFKPARNEMGQLLRSYPFNASATAKTYSDGKCNFSTCVPWSGIVYSVKLIQLPPSQLVFYSCGDDQVGMSSEFNFTSPIDANLTNVGIVFGVYGDVGSYDSSIANRDFIINTGHALQEWEFILQIGDIAYATGNQTIWDNYGRLMEPLMAFVPTLMSPGNHDGEYMYGNYYDHPSDGGESGVSYATRYPGPGQQISFNSSHTGEMNSTSFWWSLDYAQVHIVTLSGVHDFKNGSEQYAWIEADLAQAAANRKIRPWIIVTCHYPMYCSMADCFCNYTQGANCGVPFNNSQTTGVGGISMITANVIRTHIEPLLYKYNIDLFIAGHEHSYERTYPVYNFEVNSTSYHNPTGPVHIMVGTGGANPDTDWISSPPAWSVIRSDTPSTHYDPYGFLKLATSTNDESYQLNIQFYNINSTNPLFDEFTISKDFI
eukprot:TRINITY_DN5425_c0_g1_i1.p1 TRINITY_DN5425_c0_g1~~TRINITY_DN5425_c0_g1_i1.p1  ORF type:complete len:512 (+),score=90.16 TRINITY_DN5425_c0_g1_i1:56-1591(+)